MTTVLTAAIIVAWGGLAFAVAVLARRAHQRSRPPAPLSDRDIAQLRHPSVLADLIAWERELRS